MMALEATHCSVMPSWKVAVAHPSPLSLFVQERCQNSRDYKTCINPHGSGKSAAVNFLLRFEPDFLSLTLGRCSDDEERLRLDKRCSETLSK